MSFGYSTNGALTAVTDLHGGTSTYAYKIDTFLLESIHDPLNTRLILNTYDSSKRVTQQESQTGATTTYEYGTGANGGRKTTVRQWPGSVAGPAQDILIDYYRPDGTLEYQTRQDPVTNQEIFQSYTTFDGSLAAAARVDGRGNATRCMIGNRGQVGPLPAHLATDQGNQRREVALPVAGGLRLIALSNRVLNGTIAAIRVTHGLLLTARSQARKSIPDVARITFSSSFLYGSQDTVWLGCVS